MLYLSSMSWTIHWMCHEAVALWRRELLNMLCQVTGEENSASVNAMLLSGDVISWLYCARSLGEKIRPENAMLLSGDVSSWICCARSLGRKIRPVNAMLLSGDVSSWICCARSLGRKIRPVNAMLSSLETWAPEYAVPGHWGRKIRPVNAMLLSGDVSSWICCARSLGEENSARKCNVSISQLKNHS